MYNFNIQAENRILGVKLMDVTHVAFGVTIIKFTHLSSTHCSYSFHVAYVPLQIIYVFSDTP